MVKLELPAGYRWRLHACPGRGEIKRLGLPVLPTLTLPNFNGLGATLS